MANSQQLHFQLQPSPIDYFKLKEDYFKPHCNVSKDVISLSGNDKYIQYPKHLINLDLEKKETVVFNFPVGKGKTTICYDLIKEYDKLGWYVIVCSPFIKLVDKDLEKIKQKISPPYIDTGFLSGTPDKICSYHDLGNGDELTQIAYNFWPFTCNVHIMTINCLLGNPGESAIEQNIHKSRYIDDLLEATQGKKVALFIDELHESIHNFEPSFVANLLRWKNRVQKVYVASATFTPATIPAIKAISLLTDRNVHVYESDRFKNLTQAEIHLHITPYPINGYNKQFLNGIDGKIQECKNAGKLVNILTGTKSIAEKIAERSFKHVIQSEVQKRKYQGTDVVHLLTSDTELEYQKNSNNLGTNFKTGVDIVSSNEVLFIVIPTITSSLHYGIFTDGIPSIIQSVGRLRNGGEIHIFISEPDILMDQTNTGYPHEISIKKSSSYQQQNAGYAILHGEYNSKVKDLASEISQMEAGIFQPQYSNMSTQAKKDQLALWYPNFHEFLLNKSQRILVIGHTSFGKYLSPYILWACLKDQFQNATLKEIIHHLPPIKKITISQTNRPAVIKGLLAQENEYIQHNTFRSIVQNFPNLLKQSENDEGVVCQHEYMFNDKGILSHRLMKDQPGFSKAFLEEVIFVKTGERFSLLRKDYINACLLDVQQGNVYHEDKIKEAYRKLLELRDKFIHWFQSKVISKDSSHLIPTKAYLDIPDSLFYESVEVFTFLKENDKLISTDVISILQRFKGNLTDKNKEKIYKTLEELFINVTGKRVENKQFYVLEDNYVVEIQNNFTIPLL
ncbi:DEAD/DEAH box helicase family protein [Chitinophaga sp. CB10]|uniref:DEAD/DEAH box helicase family protein n=1 Tax=Chitinophaga sp. CB10 TaxID=1891659 RepID=UPI0025C5D846|nr:DEAD/DEAH box helicase family protein [Chitinophaga sp. CB10]